ncbi:MAG: hypothetical protein R3251_01740 [Candidatus Spechtbacterales bacterium]|nr:hypothetical protein [Candidatus Spechtbacterales bacterium]
MSQDKNVEKSELLKLLEYSHTKEGLSKRQQKRLKHLASKAEITDRLCISCRIEGKTAPIANNMARGDTEMCLRHITLYL